MMTFAAIVAIESAGAYFRHEPWKEINWFSLLKTVWDAASVCLFVVKELIKWSSWMIKHHWFANRKAIMSAFYDRNE